MKHDEKETQYFCEDSEELLAGMNGALLTLEKEPNDMGALEEIFRAAHTLKGNSATLKLEDMSSLTHELENVFDSLRKGDINMTSDLADCVLLCHDTLLAIVFSIEEGGDGALSTDALQARLRGYVDSDAKPAAGASQCQAVASPQASIFPALSGYEKILVEEKQSEYKNVFEIVVDMPESSVMREIIALVALNKLKCEGEILKSDPPIEEESCDDEPLRFHFLMATDMSENEIIDLISCSDIESISFFRAESNGVDAGGGEPDLSAMIDSGKPKDETPNVNSAASETATPSGSESVSGSSKSIRVDTSRLDAIMNLVGELVINRTRQQQFKLALSELEYEIDGAHEGGAIANKLKALSGEFDECLHQMGRVTGKLQDRVMRIRMLPIGTVFSRFERVVRDLARQTGRQVNLTIQGREAELDKNVLELVGDPLMHMIRNSIAHGIETPAERVKAGKSPTGNLALRAFHEGNYVLIEIEDDGRGINPDAVRNAAVRRGIITREEADALSTREAINLIFRPSFSTTEEADSVSGRGVGLDVVSKNIERINGAINIETRIGQGTKFTLRIPLTLAIIQALLVEVGGEVYAIPLFNILEAYRIRPGDVETIDGHEVTLLRGNVLSLMRLNKALGLPSSETDSEYLYVVVVGVSDKKAGLIVDKFRGRQEIVIKSLGEEGKDIPGVSGASIRGDGQVMLIIDVYSLVEMAAAKAMEQTAAK